MKYEFVIGKFRNYNRAFGEGHWHLIFEDHQGHSSFCGQIKSRELSRSPHLNGKEIQVEELTAEAIEKVADLFSKKICRQCVKVAVHYIEFKRFGINQEDPRYNAIKVVAEETREAKTHDHTHA